MAEAEIETTFGYTETEGVTHSYAESEFFERDSEYEIEKLEELRKAQNTEVFTIIGFVY